MQSSGARHIPDPSTIESVFIFRPDNLGDLVLFSGAFRHIRHSYKNAEITVCTKKYARNLMELCPYVDRILTWEETSASMFPIPLRPLIPLMLRSIRLPIPRWMLWSASKLLTMENSAHLAMFPIRSPTWGHHAIAMACKSKFKYGVAGDYCNQASLLDRAVDSAYSARLRVPLDKRWDHEFAVTRSYLELLGIHVQIKELWPELWTDAEDIRWAHEKMTVDAINNSITVGISPGANRPGRIYPPAKIAQALSRLGDLHFSYMILGTTSESSLCGELETNLRRLKNTVQVANLSGKTTQRRLIECLRLCDIILAPETAVLHLATALHKPTVGIMGGGHYGRFYPWGNPDINRVAARSMDCYLCNWNCRHDRVRCISEIHPETITSELSYICEKLR